MTSSRRWISRGRSMYSAACVTPPAAAGNRAEASAADLAAVSLALCAQSSLRIISRCAAPMPNSACSKTRSRHSTGRMTSPRIATKAESPRPTDVDQAETQRQTARAQLASVKLQRAQLEHAIAGPARQGAFQFLARSPRSWSAARRRLTWDCPRPCCFGVLTSPAPSARLPPPTPNIGVARAAWFPVFTLGGSGGYEGSATSNWFEAPSRFWSAGPTATLPLLDVGGRIADEPAGSCGL